MKKYSICILALCLSLMASLAVAAPAGGVNIRTKWLNAPNTSDWGGASVKLTFYQVLAHHLFHPYYVMSHVIVNSDNRGMFFGTDPVAKTVSLHNAWILTSHGSSYKILPSCNEIAMVKNNQNLKTIALTFLFANSSNLNNAEVSCYPEYS